MREWLGALERRDMAALVRLTRYPFDVRDQGKHARCKAGKTAETSDELAAALECLLKNEPFERALRDSATHDLNVDDHAATAPDWGERWRRKEQAGLRSLFTIVATQTTAYSLFSDEFDLLLLVGPDAAPKGADHAATRADGQRTPEDVVGVRALWKSGSSVSYD